MKLRDHTYRGRLIRPCAYASGQHRGRWIIQAIHYGTGIPYSDDQCDHYQTLSDARASIDDTKRHQNA